VGCGPDFRIDFDTRRFVPWETRVPLFKYDSSVPFFQILVPLLTLPGHWPLFGDPMALEMAGAMRQLHRYIILRIDLIHVVPNKISALLVKPFVFLLFFLHFF
jgi:hypothetical protein